MYQDYLNKIVTLKDKYRQSRTTYYFKVASIGDIMVQLKCVHADDELDPWWNGHRSMTVQNFVRTYETVDDPIIGLLYE